MESPIAISGPCHQLLAKSAWKFDSFPKFCQYCKVPEVRYETSTITCYSDLGGGSITIFVTIFLNCSGSKNRSYYCELLIVTWITDEGKFTGISFSNSLC
ncbi:unnamed protein product [Allacma fusca]|uniref:Uncharacterized protein n=1 Tax=Allacma fusca TaxID=39272 RepID=A0A8J2NVV9_9HEXA|nr:unnamed protein product [Allacma fusca]